MMIHVMEECDRTVPCRVMNQSDKRFLTTQRKSPNGRADRPTWGFINDLWWHWTREESEATVYASQAEAQATLTRLGFYTLKLWFEDVEPTHASRTPECAQEDHLTTREEEGA